MKNYKLLIQYDGTRYRGWQKQGNTANTIQGRIENILSQWSGEEIELHGSGRTDAGVHALGQIANVKFHRRTLQQLNKDFNTDNEIEAEMLTTLNHYLPLDIRVLSIAEVDERFHARLHAKRKHYRYQIDNKFVSDVFGRKYLTRFSDKDYFYQSAKKQNKLGSAKSQEDYMTACQILYDLEEMQSAISYLTGEHDFMSFCDNKRMKKSSVRIIDHIELSEQNHILTLDFYGNGFLYHMVRILTGTLLEVGIGIKKPEEISSILQAHNREYAGFCAPAQGLTLVSVTYD